MPHSTSQNNLSQTITHIDLLRHGECVDGRCYRGWNDVALSEKGWQQMRSRIAAHGGHWDHIATSSLKRCADFATELSTQQGVDLSVHKHLREIHFGEWEGRALDEVWAEQPERVQQWFDNPEHHAPPGGETGGEFAARVIAAFEALVQQHAGKKLLFVVHGGVIRALLAHGLDMPLSAMNRIDVPYAAMSHLQVTRDGEASYYRLCAHNSI